MARTRRSESRPTALVTGAARGIGQAIAIALADAGYHVGVNDLSVDRLAQTMERLGDRATPVAGDIADRQAIEAMFRTVAQEMGPLDVLVNNAGIGRPFGPVASVDPDEWWRSVEIMVRGTFLCSYAALDVMLPRRSGRMVNVASNAGLVPIPNLSANTVAKTAIIRLTEQIAVETRDAKIAVFAINPGPVRTPMTEEAVNSPDVATLAPNISANFRQLFEAGGDVSPRRAADLVVRLAGGEADALSGAFIDIQAGDDLEVMIGAAETIEREELHRLRLQRYTKVDGR